MRTNAGEKLAPADVAHVNVAAADSDVFEVVDRLSKSVSSELRTVGAHRIDARARPVVVCPEHAGVASTRGDARGFTDVAAIDGPPVRARLEGRADCASRVGAKHGNQGQNDTQPDHYLILAQKACNVNVTNEKG